MAGGGPSSNMGCSWCSERPGCFANPYGFFGLVNLTGAFSIKISFVIFFAVTTLNQDSLTLSKTRAPGQMIIFCGMKEVETVGYFQGLTSYILDASGRGFQIRTFYQLRLMAWILHLGGGTANDTETLRQLGEEALNLYSCISSCK